MMTGQYPQEHGIYHNTGILSDKKTTWPAVLRDAGYETVAVGRSHGITAGFDRVVFIPHGDSHWLAERIMRVGKRVRVSRTPKSICAVPSRTLLL